MNPNDGAAVGGRVNREVGGRRARILCAIMVLIVEGMFEAESLGREGIFKAGR
jgi:hypothetical protein